MQKNKLPVGAGAEESSEAPGKDAGTAATARLEEDDTQKRKSVAVAVHCKDLRPSPGASRQTDSNWANAG